MITFNGAIEQTEHRYSERAAPRREQLRLIGSSRIFEANPPDLVQKRLARLSADYRVVNAIRSEGLNFATAAPGASVSGFPRALERVLLTNDLMSVGFFERGLQVSLCGRADQRAHA